jgi:two-component system LytT family response regulator
MKVILIDDERLALNFLEHQLIKIADIDVIGKFVDPIMGKEKILYEDVDVVFLDINLSEINGLELAEQILETKPKLNIVFVTAYDEYAVKAFELNALDYVVKPIGTERLSKTMERTRERVTPDNASPTISPIQMKLFRQVLIESAEQQFTPMLWRTTRAQELFLYLLQHRGQLVRKSVLIDLLWPEYELSKVYSQLYTAVYHIRKSLEQFGDRFQISNTMEGYILNIKNVVIDVEEWENNLHSEPPITSETINRYKELKDLYTGDYLQEYDYWWAESERHRLMLLWLRLSSQMAKWYLACNDVEKAVEMYLEICNRHQQAEDAHFALMKIYSSINNHLSVKRQYRLLTSILLEELNEQPSPYITEWFYNWNEENKE